jgi:hypothetical protein
MADNKEHPGSGMFALFSILAVLLVFIFGFILACRFARWIGWISY